MIFERSVIEMLIISLAKPCLICEDSGEVKAIEERELKNLGIGELASKSISEMGPTLRKLLLAQDLIPTFCYVGLNDNAETPSGPILQASVAQ